MEYLAKIIDEAIGNILKRLIEKEEYFESERHLMFSLAHELKYILGKDNRSINVIMEYDEINFNLNADSNNDTLKRKWKIDIVINIDNKNYLIELKYSAYKKVRKNIYAAGSNCTTARKNFLEDKEKLADIVNKYKESIDCGFCILITTSNIQSYFEDIKPNEEWKDIGDRYSYLVERIKS